MEDERCPRCREPLPAEVYLEELPTLPGHHPAYRLRHKRASGAKCVAYIGPARTAADAAAAMLPLSVRYTQRTGRAA